jgi:hypothetical protein
LLESQRATYPHQKPLTEIKLLMLTAIRAQLLHSLRSSTRKTAFLHGLVFIQLFFSFVDAAGKKPYYPAMVKFLKESGPFKFEVKFQHLLDHDINMAIHIANHPKKVRWHL